MVLPCLLARHLAGIRVKPQPGHTPLSLHLQQRTMHELAPSNMMHGYACPRVCACQSRVSRMVLQVEALPSPLCVNQT